MKEIVVGPPDASDVRVGALWRAKTKDGVEVYVLVMTPLTDHIWNYAFWPVDGEFADAQVSMINAATLAIWAEFVASPLPALVTMIERVVHAAEQKEGENVG